MREMRLSYPEFWLAFVGLVIAGILIGVGLRIMYSEKEITLLETQIENYKSNALEFEKERAKLEVLIEKLLEYIHEVKRIA